MALDEAVSRFAAYVKGFDQPDPDDQSHIDLKREHTLRVLQEAQGIIASLDLDSHQAVLVELAALFHDIGRFPQFARFGTFQDRQSVNHGLMGYQVLRKEDLLPPMPWVEKKRILLTVLMHNRARLVPGLPSDLERMLRIVRDADKLDVIRVLIKHFDPRQPHNAVVTLGLPHDPARYSPAALEQVRSRRMVRYEQMHWLNDFKLLLLSWTYDLNFRHTRLEFLNREYVPRLAKTLPGTQEVDAVKGQVVQDLSEGMTEA